MKIETNNGFIWKIKSSRNISGIDVDYIRAYNPVIYNNDLDGTEWAYDRKLPSGAWLESITVKHDKGKIVYHAVIC